MGRNYASILGPLALAIELIRGAVMNFSPLETFTWAWMALMVFSVLGYVIGGLAGRVVEESVRQRIESELAAQGEGKAA